MKRLNLILILVLVVPIMLSAQTGWTEHTLDGNFSSFGQAQSVYAVDLNGGGMDVLGTAYNTSAGVGDICWWNNHSGNKRTIDYNFSNALAVYAANIDGDSTIDVVATSATLGIAWWKNNGGSSPSWTKYIISSTALWGVSIFAIDMDGDEDVDVVALANYDLIWWENLNGIGTSWAEHAIGYSERMFPIDMDGDGDIDILGDGSWWENLDDIGTSWAEHAIPGFSAWSGDVYAVDIDDDGDVDILGACGDEVVWGKNDGNENFTIYTIYDVSAAHTSDVFAIDVNGDSAIDVVSAACNRHDIFWFENDGSENFTRRVIDSDFSSPYSLYAIDLDNDDDVDVVAQGYDDITWWENEMVVDVGVASINTPAFVPIDTTLHPKATVTNEGTESETFSVTCEINGTYTSTKTVTNLIGGHSVNVTFDDTFTFDEIGSYTVTVYTQLGLDENPANDTLEKVIEVFTTDVGVIEIDIPDTLPADTTFQPHAIVKNFSSAFEQSFDVTCEIEPGGYTKDRKVWNLAPGDSIQINFLLDFHFPSENCSYTITVYTHDPDGDLDENPTNDTLQKVVTVIHDVGTVSIDIPSTLPIDTTLNPQATVKNFALNTETFRITCEIDPGEYSSTAVSNLAPGENVQVTFPDQFTFMNGLYIVTVYTHGLVGIEDGNPANDTLEKIIEPGSGVDDWGSMIPQSFSFGLKNNPSKDKAMFNLALPEAATVTLRIYDVTGRLVSKVISGRRSAGYYEIPWTPNVTAGVYLYKLESPWKSVVGKLVIVQ